MKVALVQKNIGDDALRGHLILHAGRLVTYDQVAEEVRNILVTRQALAPLGVVAMDVGELELEAFERKGKGKGKDGKGKGKHKGKDKDGKGKGKDKDKNDKGPDGKSTDGKKDDIMVCFYCHKKGHRKAECRAFAADKASGKLTQLNALSTEWGNDEIESWLFAFECDEEIIELDQLKSEPEVERLMVDSGTGVAVCPLAHAPDVEMHEVEHPRRLLSACGATVEHHVLIDEGRDGSRHANPEFDSEDDTFVVRGGHDLRLIHI